jgi:hypothetical protein
MNWLDYALIATNVAIVAIMAVAALTNAIPLR